MSTTSSKNAALSQERTQEPYPAQKARQGEIILKTKLSRIIFFTGLFGGFVLLAAIALFFGITS